MSSADSGAGSLLRLVTLDSGADEDRIWVSPLRRDKFKRVLLIRELRLERKESDGFGFGKGCERFECGEFGELTSTWDLECWIASRSVF